MCGKPLGRRNTSGYCRKHFHPALNNAPEMLEKRLEKLRATIGEPGYRAKRIAHLTRISRDRLAWCPIEYRDEYRRLTRSKMLPAAEARKAIKDMIAADVRRYHSTGQLQQAIRTTMLRAL